MPTPIRPESQPPAEADTARQFIIFGTDWNRHPSTIQHLARRLAADHRILWVETVGLRAPSLSWYDIKRSWQKLADFATSRRERIATVYPNIQILCPVTLPFTFIGLVRRFNRWSVRRRLMGSGIATSGSAVLVLTCPHQVDYIGLMPVACSLYFCMDDYALWPGMNVRQIAQMERLMIERVDGIAAVSEHLVERASGYGKPSLVVSQGVDLDHFALPPPSENKTRPEIVYFGIIDSRIDQELLLKVSQAFPKALIRLIGPQVSGEMMLRQARNILIEPAEPYASLPKAVATADVFILPFVPNPLTNSCTPLKLKEYLATGRPVVSTLNPTVAEWREHVQMASSHEDFILQLDLALHQARKAMSGSLRQILQSETWDIKAAQFLSFVKQVSTIQQTSERDLQDSGTA